MTLTQPTSTSTASFSDVIGARHSARKFLPKPLSREEIQTVLKDAQTSPSNSNTQPWTVHIASGDTRDLLSERMVASFEADRDTSDFTFDYGDGLHKERSRAHGAALYGSWGIERSDVEARREVARENLRFYGAPHVALLFMPMLGDGVRTAGDIGMYAQTFLLSLTAHGFHGIPQTILGFYAADVRETLRISEEQKLLFGISFGRADLTASINNLRMPRVPVDDSVVFHA